MGFDMKCQIVVEINHNDQTCGTCKYADCFIDGGLCWLFINDMSATKLSSSESGNFIRCDECIKAEKESKNIIKTKGKRWFKR